MTLLPSDKCNKDCNCHFKPRKNPSKYGVLRGCRKICRIPPACDVDRYAERVRHHTRRLNPDIIQRQRQSQMNYYFRNQAIIDIKIRRGNFERKNKLLEILGGKCVRCGITDPRCLQIDHINGGGRVDYIKYGNSQQMVRHYLKDTVKAKETLQILCANCNWIKEYEKWHKF